MKMGVVDRRGKVVRLSQLWRNYGRMGFPPDITSSPRSDGREVIYVGHLPPHFGHFILEGLSRLWFAAQHPELPIAWACRTEEPVATYTRWQAQMLQVLGITNEPIFVREPTRFRKVHVPEAGFRIKDFFSDQLARFLAVYPARPREPGTRIWLSRASVESEHGSVYASRLDEQLAEHGWGSSTRSACPSATSWSCSRRLPTWLPKRAPRCTCWCCWLTSRGWRSTSSVVGPTDRPKARTPTTGPSRPRAASRSGST
jgi:hypothetical protein